MKKMKIRNNANSYVADYEKERNDLPSVTVPNEGYTIRNLMVRHMNGNSLPPIAKNVEWGDHDEAAHSQFDYEELSRADLVDKMDAADQLREVVKRGKAATEKVAAKKAAAAKAEADELNAIKAEFKKRASQKDESKGSGKKESTDDN